MAGADGGAAAEARLAAVIKPASASIFIDFILTPMVARRYARDRMILSID
jgi:hypothetical protein